MNPQATHYLEVLPSELIWQILDQLPSGSLRNLCSALPSLQLESFVHECEASCPHGLPIRALPACDPVHEWESKHRQYRLRDNLDKGILCNRDVYALCDTSSLNISTDGNLLTSLFDDSLLCINSVRLRPHTFYRGSLLRQSFKDGPQGRAYAQLHHSNDGRWIALTCTLKLEKSREHVFSGFQVNELSWPEADIEANLFSDDPNPDLAWLLLIDSAHEPAVLTRVCIASRLDDSEIQFSTDSMYLMLLHKDEESREAYGAGCLLSLRGHRPVYLDKLRHEIEMLADPVLACTDSEAESEHFVVSSCDDTYAVYSCSGRSHCTRLFATISTRGSIFSHRDKDRHMSVFSYDKSFHIFDHHKDKPMSLRETVKRLDDLGGSVCNIDLRQLPGSVVYTLHDQDTYTWVEQTLSADAPSMSRVIASSSEFHCCISGKPQLCGQLQKILAAPLVFITATEDSEEHDFEKESFTLLAWSKDQHGWSSTVIGDFSISWVNGERTRPITVEVSACGTAFALINDNTVTIAEVSAGTVSCKSISCPPSFGAPMTVLFASVDESLFVLFENPDVQVCRKAPEYRVIRRDPLSEKRNISSDDQIAYENKLRGRLIANYKCGKNWDLRWCALVEDLNFDSMSTDGSIMMFTDGWSTVVLDFSPEG